MSKKKTHEEYIEAGFITGQEFKSVTEKYEWLCPRCEKTSPKTLSEVKKKRFSGVCTECIRKDVGLKKRVSTDKYIEAGFLPNQDFTTNKEKYEWQCPKCKKIESKQLGKISKKRLCHECSMTDMKNKSIPNKEECKDRGFIEEIKVCRTSQKQYKWQCPKCKRIELKRVIAVFKKTFSGVCTKCSNDNTGILKHLPKETYIENNFDPNQNFTTTSKLYWWICQCGEKELKRISTVTQKGFSGLCKT